MKPCHKCGGKKDRGVRGLRYCSKCRPPAEWVMQPCVLCGKEKIRGIKGSRYCEDCRSERTAKRIVDQKGRLTRPHAPCEECGGPKVPEGQKAQRGQRVCEGCKSVRKEKDRQRRAETHRKNYLKKGRKRSSTTPKSIPSKPVKIPLVRSRAKKIPKDLQALWYSADRNSIIRRKYPTIKALIEGMGE